MYSDSLKVVIENSKQAINIFGFSIDIVVFTVLTPIVIFFIGYWLNRRYDNRKEKNKLYDIRLYFYSQIETLIKATSKQTENVDLFIKDLKKETIRNLTFNLSADFQIKHLSALPKTDLFSVIVSKEKKNREKRLSIFWNCQQAFDLVEWHSNNFKDRFVYIFTHCSDYEKRWNEAIDWVGKFHDKWVVNAVNNKIDVKKDPFLNEFWQIFHYWAYLENARDMYVAEKKLIDPLISHCKNLLPDQYALYLLEPLLKCKAAVDNHRNLRNISIDEFDKYSEGLNKIYNDLSNSLKELKETQKF